MTDILVIGDSLSQDPYLGDPANVGLFAGWPDIFRKAGHRVTSIAVSSSTAYEWTLNAPLPGRDAYYGLVTPQIDTVRQTPGAVVVLLCTNDLRLGYTALDCEGWITTLVNRLLADMPWLSRVNLGTTPPFGDHAALETQRLAYNVWVRSQTATIVPCEVALFVDPGSTGSLPAWANAGDGIHPTAPGGIGQFGLAMLATAQLSIDAGGPPAAPTWPVPRADADGDRVDWSVVRGDTDELGFTVTINGSTDITAAEVRMRIRDVRDSSTLEPRMSDVVLANVAAGGAADEIAITDSPAGELSVYLKATTFTDAGLTGRPGEVVSLPYDLEVLRADGQRRTVAYGFLLCRIDVTA